MASIANSASSYSLCT